MMKYFLLALIMGLVITTIGYSIKSSENHLLRGQIAALQEAAKQAQKRIDEERETYNQASIQAGKNYQQDLQRIKNEHAQALAAADALRRLFGDSCRGGANHQAGAPSPGTANPGTAGLPEAPFAQAPTPPEWGPADPAEFVTGLLTEADQLAAKYTRAQTLLIACYKLAEER